MTPSQFIQQELENLKEFHKREVSKEELVNEVFRLLMSKKFRKYSVTPNYLDHIHTAIKTSIDKDEPIKLTLVFGGYKLWRLDESPEVDWAELFSLIYYANWLKPICDIYEHGVWLDFYSDDVILEIMNNIPKENTEKYAQTFLNLLEFIKPYIPQNLKITLNRVRDQYENYEAFKKELMESIEKVKAEIGLPELTNEQRQLVELNVKLNPNQNIDPQWREKVFLVHEGYANVSKRRPYYRKAEKIFVSTGNLKDSLPVGSTKTSIAKFWVGVGALKKDGEIYKEYVLSPKQLESANFSKENIEIEGLDTKNFKSIRIINS